VSRNDPSFFLIVFIMASTLIKDGRKTDGRGNRLFTKAHGDTVCEIFGCGLMCKVCYYKFSHVKIF